MIMIGKEMEIRKKTILVYLEIISMCDNIYPCPVSNCV